MSNMIILTPDDKAKIAEYTGLGSLQSGVGGYIEALGIKSFKINEETIDTVMYCDEEYRIKNSGEYCKINALATMLSNIPVYGDVVIIGVDGCNEFGFDEIQTNSIMNFIEKYKVEYNEVIIYTHIRNDGKLRF